ncbi:MAG TPA: CoA pyrophosphatase [Aggregatilineales bacterium]|nr:CoA pyrophosphatase [Aggregatilineales bacterium]
MAETATIPTLVVHDRSTLPALTLDVLRRAVALSGFDPAPAQLRMAPRPRPLRRAADRVGNPRLAAVLILVYPILDKLYFTLMRRPEYEGVHSGQISLPGGSREGDETFEQTALRESREEVGVTAPVQVIGALTPIYVPPSDFEIHPIVGTLPQRPTLKADPGEVAEIIEAPLSILLDEQLKGSEELRRDGFTFTVGYYRVGSHKVWGATAAILSELEARLQRALQEN